MRALLLVLLALAGVASAAAPAARVEGINFAFVDDESGSFVTSIPLGGTVLWDIVQGRHTITSRAGGPLLGWGIGNIDAGQTYAHTFELPGAYPYHCRWHPGMDGVVIVA